MSKRKKSCHRVKHLKLFEIFLFVEAAAAIFAGVVAIYVICLVPILYGTKNSLRPLVLLKCCCCV